MIFKNKYVIFGVCMLLSAAIAFFIVPSQNKKLAEGEDVVRVVRIIEAIPTDENICRAT